MAGVIFRFCQVWNGRFYSSDFSEWFEIRQQLLVTLVWMNVGQDGVGCWFPAGSVFKAHAPLSPERGPDGLITHTAPYSRVLSSHSILLNGGRDSVSVHHISVSESFCLSVSWIKLCIWKVVWSKGQRALLTTHIGIQSKIIYTTIKSVIHPSSGNISGYMLMTIDQVCAV